MMRPTMPVGADNPSSASQAIRMVDQQIASINDLSIPSGFSGAEQMQMALIQMQSTARGWPPVKRNILFAAQACVAYGAYATKIGMASEDAQKIIQEVSEFKVHDLNDIVTRFSSTKTQFDAFNQAMEDAYSQGANANQAAATAIDQRGLDIQNRINNLNAQINNLDSAGSIFLDIISLGGVAIADIVKIRSEISELNSEKQYEYAQERSYQLALYTFQNALNSTKLTSYALSTVGVSLQQSVNALDDVTAGSSKNLVVLRALLAQFKSQYAGAVTDAQKFLA